MRVNTTRDDGDHEDRRPAEQRKTEHREAWCVEEGRRHLGLIDPGSAREHEGHAAIDRERAQRRDDGGDADLPHHEAVDGAEHRSDGQGANDQDRQRDSRIGRVHHRHGHAGEGEIGGDRQVDGLGQDHRRLAERKDDQDGRYR